MMFGSYKELEREAAAAVMNTVAKRQRTKTWERILNAMRSTSAEPTTSFAEADDGEFATTRLTSTLARVGQGTFRTALMLQWGGGCAVTGLTCEDILRASHVKPWSRSNSREKLDPNNGLLLVAHLDALFDCGLISFDDEGKMLLSSRLVTPERTYFGLPQTLRLSPNEKLRSYLAHHRKEIFDRS